MRFSYYNILSRRLDEGGYALLNGLTGAIDLISEEMKNIIVSSGEKEIASEDIEFLKEDLDNLVKRGYITGKSLEEEFDYALDIAEQIDSANRSKTGETFYSLLLIPNYNCNYRCVYCFERENPYMKSHCDSMISREQVDAFYSFTDSHSAKKAITLYGGEPLNKCNLDIVDYIITQGISREFKFYAISNGHDLDYFLPYIGKNKIEFLQITIDGPKFIHDKRRIPLSGDSSFDKVTANLKKVLEIDGISVVLRVNIDKSNIKSLKILFDELKEQKIYPDKKLKIMGGLVTGAGKLEVSYDEADDVLEPLYRCEPELRSGFMDMKSFVTELIQTALIFDMPVIRRISACPVPESMLIFAPDWKIYSCSDFVGYEELAIGTFDKEGVIRWNRENRNLWMSAKVHNNKTCVQCPYAFLCAGGCHKHVLEGVSYDAGRCNFYKTRFPGLLGDAVNAFLNKKEEE